MTRKKLIQIQMKKLKKNSYMKKSGRIPPKNTTRKKKRNLYAFCLNINGASFMFKIE